VQFVVVQAVQFPLNYVVHDVEHDEAVHVKQVELYCVEHDPQAETLFTKYPELHVVHSVDALHVAQFDEQSPHELTVHVEGFPVIIVVVKYPFDTHPFVAHPATVVFVLIEHPV